MTVQNFCSMNARSVDEDFVGILITNPPRTISQVQRSFGLFRAHSRVRVHICIMVGLVVACSSIPGIVRNRSSHPRILRIHAGYIPGSILPRCRINQRSLRPNIRWSITFSPNSNLSARYGGPHCSTHGESPGFRLEKCGHFRPLNHFSGSSTPRTPRGRMLNMTRMSIPALCPHH